jgi:thiamine-monophosphate kinase
MKENDFLEWIYSQGGFDARKVIVGPGDDMAVVKFPRDELLVAVDQVLDGVHFDLSRHGPKAAGRKAMARNLSDIAAMAALPVGAVASVSLPKNFTQKQAQQIYLGLREIGDEFDCPVVGGDVSTWTGPLAISVTVFAQPAGATGGVKPVLRNGGRAGQAIFVTGELGGSWHTERHLTFKPRVTEAIVLALRYKIKSMMDISDGIAKDLRRMCKASGCGAEIFAAQLPIHADATAGRKIDPLDAALFDGEDYELLFTIPAGQKDKLIADSGSEHLPFKVTYVGNMISGEDVELVTADGHRATLPDGGWEHTTDSSR